MEMESWIRRSSRSRLRGRDTERDGGGMGRSRGREGIYCPGEGIGILKPATDTTCSIKPSSEENMRYTSRKDRLPIKMLIEEEMAKEFEPRRAYSSVVARLMGLDAFPIPRSGHINKKESEKCTHRASMVGSRERNLSSADQSFTSIKDQQQFKDVFEAYHSYKVDKHQDTPSEKGTPKQNWSENDIKFIRKKFLDAKHLATNGKFYDSKDFNDALDVLDSNKDLFLKFLQEPSSLFAKHLHDLHQVPSKHKSSNITILRSSKFTDLDFPSNCLSEKEVESQMQIRKCDVNGSRIIDSDMICHSAKEQPLSRSCKVAKSKSEKKGGRCSLPTRIVVLKPTVERVQISDSVSFPSCTEKSHFVYRKHKEYQGSRTHKLFSEVRDCQKLSDDVSSHRRDSLRNPQQASKHMKHIVTNDSLDECFRNIGVQKMREKFTLLHRTTFQRQSLGHFDDWKRNITPSHSSESSLSREAKKHLSKRWRISNRSQKEPCFELANESSSTLGEMLDLSDKDFFTKDFKNDIHPIWDQPSCISRDDHKGEYSRRLARSRSFSGSSSFQVNSRRNRTASFGDEDFVILKDILNHVSDKSPESSNIHKEAMHFKRDTSSINPSSRDPVPSEENGVTLHDIHAKSDKYHTSFLTELSETSAAVYYDAVALIDDSNDVESAQAPYNLIKSQLPSCDVSAESMEDAASTCKNLISEETSARQCHDVTIDNSHASELESPITREHELFVISKDAEQPSPVSVLAPLDEEEGISPECFERLNTDIQGLRLQLQLLRMESNCEERDGSDVSCDEETDMDGIIFPQSTEILGVSTDKDERDFSYLLDMLADSGLQDATMDMVSAVCHLLECPVSPDVFERLEKIYEEPSVWTRSERKLLFDLINFLLTDLVTPHMNPRPWIKPFRKIRAVEDKKVTADELWHLFVERRSKLICDPSEPIMDASWWDLGDVIIDTIGMKIEKMLRDELLDEIVSELVT